MKKLAPQLLAFAIAILAALASFNILRGMKSTQGPLEPLSVIGQIQSTRGQVEHRLPRTVEILPAQASTSLYNQELILTGPASEAVLTLNNGTQVQLNENTRIVIELDATKSGALLATILEGQASLLQKGAAGSFRAFQGGKEVDLSRSQNTRLPVLTIGRSASDLGETAVDETNATITATTPDESAVAQTPAPPTQTAAKPNDLGTETLANDEIAKQLKTQTGFFQRCYLTFINRLRSQNKDPNAQVAGPGGTITLGFTIQSNGKVADAQVVRSDFKDSTLNKCAVDVVERTRFRPFDGEAIPVLEFPIAF